MKKVVILKFLFSLTVVLTVVVISCNNPFGTRKPQKPDKISGAAIKPANSPENVLYNLKASFESMSIQDYIDIFSDDFMFNPDPEDSVLYLEDFRDGWGIEKEKTFVENFLQASNVSEMEFSTHTYEYKAGEDMYDYLYSIMVFPAVDSTKTDVEIPEKYNIKGHAWLYLREDTDGNWRIFKWTETANMIENVFITWGVLRVRNVGY